MSENRPLPNIPTDSKTTLGIFKTQKTKLKNYPLKSKKNLKKPQIKKCQKTEPPNMPTDSKKKSIEIFKLKKSKVPQNRVPQNQVPQNQKCPKIKSAPSNFPQKGLS